MADNKYGRVFTASDVDKIIEFLYDEEYLATDEDLDVDGILRDMDAKDIRFKFEPDEPIFVLRGHDKRAIGAIKHYQEHQASNAPANHTEAIDKALAAFDAYRKENPGKLKEPD